MSMSQLGAAISDWTSFVSAIHRHPGTPQGSGRRFLLPSHRKRSAPHCPDLRLLPTLPTHHIFCYSPAYHSFKRYIQSKASSVIPSTFTLSVLLFIPYWRAP